MALYKQQLALKEAYNRQQLKECIKQQETIKTYLIQQEIDKKKAESVEKKESVKKKVPTERKKKEKIPASVKNTLWSLYFGNSINGNCQCCKTETISKNNFDCGHVIAEKNGGKVELDNLKPVCRSCNSSMSTNNMNDFITKYGFDKIKIN